MAELFSACGNCGHSLSYHNEYGCIICVTCVIKFIKLKTHPEPDERGLYPFDADKKCEKCGYDKIETEYVNHKEGYFCSVVVGCMIPGEHMHRTCNRCGFGWVENILIKEADNGSGVDASPEGSTGEAL